MIPREEIVKIGTDFYIQNTETFLNKESYVWSSDFHYLIWLVRNYRLEMPKMSQILPK